MKTIITRKEELTTTSWSGGTTTQLAIHPPGSSLQERNFLFRISTAVVEAETSAFTRLPGVHRVIMILEGTLELEHVGHYSKTLHKSETDSFPGNWETRSRGKVSDFNLMTTGRTNGEVELIAISEGNKRTFKLGKDRNVAGIFVLNGELGFQRPSKYETIERGDFITAFLEKNRESFSVRAVQECEFVLVSIELDPFQ